MRKDLTETVAIVDRSGSMAVILDDAQGGVNSLIKDQKNGDGECNFTLVQFDTEYEVIHDGIPIGDVSEYELKPRGGTALLDAIGQTINTVGNRLSKMPESERPSLVVVAIATDGHENSSKEFNKSQIKEMIERQQNVYSWKFIFLGANQDAFSEAGGIGINAQSAADFGVNKIQNAYAAASSNILRMRSDVFAGVSAESVDCSFTDAERESMV